MYIIVGYEAMYEGYRVQRKKGRKNILYIHISVLSCLLLE